MQATEIPFVKLVGIENKNSTLFPDYKENVKNHIETIHASAQFTLAETQSGVHLQTIFPELEEVRDTYLLYRGPLIKSDQRINVAFDPIVDLYPILERT